MLSSKRILNHYTPTNQSERNCMFSMHFSRPLQGEGEASSSATTSPERGVQFLKRKRIIIILVSVILLSAQCVVDITSGVIYQLYCYSGIFVQKITRANVRFPVNTGAMSHTLNKQLPKASRRSKTVKLH